MQTTILPMIDGVRLVVPDKLTQITSYVLAEQQDWFEDEIRFIRRLVMPGHKVIDIGASLGVYTLAMAKRAGSTGRVWAFEPYIVHSDLLKSSIQLNQFANVVLDERAVSDRTGHVEIGLNIQTERVSMRHEGQSSAQQIMPVASVTLDDAAVTYAWQDIDFVKIDAEGEELAILRGGEKFLRQQSPLVQFEIKHDTEQDLTAARKLLELGYSMYRFVLGINALVPVDIQRPIDPFLLNLFGCKPDRADRLAAQGLLLRASDIIPELEEKILQESIAPGPHTYTQWLTKKPYAERLTKAWKRHVASGQSQTLVDALNLYGLGRDILRPTVERWIAFTWASRKLGGLCQTQSVDATRCFSYARIALEVGDRGAALIQIAKAMSDYLRQRKLNLDEPFLPPASRYDYLPPHDAIGSWLIASATEAFEFSRHFSSYFALEDSVPRLESIRDLGYSNDVIDRRLTLVKRLIQERDRISATS